MRTGGWDVWRLSRGCGGGSGHDDPVPSLCDGVVVASRLASLELSWRDGYVGGGWVRRAPRRGPGELAHRAPDPALAVGAVAAASAHHDPRPSGTRDPNAPGGGDAPGHVADLALGSGDRVEPLGPAGLAPVDRDRGDAKALLAGGRLGDEVGRGRVEVVRVPAALAGVGGRSEEHTSELQSRENLVCRLLLEKKKKT